MLPAVVIQAFNRPDALARLLRSVEDADYGGWAGVPLVISIDCAPGGVHPQVRDLAERTPWPHGEKQVLVQPQPRGLVEHFYRCGDLARDYGAVILLEDDLFVSPAYYAFAAQALEFYREDARVAGVSLYTLPFNGYTHLPFIPLLDGGDGFFLQIPYTQGQAFTAAQWQAFQDWRAAADRRLTPADPLHEMFLNFSEEEWFPLRTKYLVDTHRYYVFPRGSLATGFGDRGTHFSRPTRFFQVPLQAGPTGWRLLPLDDALAVYDSFYELLPDRLARRNPLFPDGDFDVDLNGAKSAARLRPGYVLTTRRIRRPRFTFARELRPIEANVLYNLPGTGIAFGRVEAIDWRWLVELERKKRDYEEARHYPPPGRKLRFLFVFVSVVEKIRAAITRLA